MNKYFFIMLTVMMNFSLMAQVNTNKEPFLTKSLKGESFSVAMVRTSGGNIVVTGIDQEESRVEVFVSPGNGRDKLSKEEIQQRIDEMYELEIAVSNNKLVAIAKPKSKIRNWKNALNIGFKLFVAKSIETDLKTSGGNIEISGLTGRQDFSTSGGNLTIDHVKGNIKGRTSGGNISVRNSGEDMDLSTSGGNIDASNCTGKIRLGTSGGSLLLKELDGDVKATTSGGNIDGKHISGELLARTSGGNIHFKDLACSLEATTSGGDIHVSVKELRKYITITNSSGIVELDLPAGKGLDLALKANKVKTDRLQNFTGKMEDNEIVGELNGGGVPVRVKAGGGRIVLSLK